MQNQFFMPMSIISLKSGVFIYFDKPWICFLTQASGHTIFRKLKILSMILILTLCSFNHFEQFSIIYYQRRDGKWNCSLTRGELLYNIRRQKGGDLTQSYDKSPYTNIVGDPRSIALHCATFISRGPQREISRLRVCQNGEMRLVALRNLTAIFSQSLWTFLTSHRLWRIMSASTPAEWVQLFTRSAVLIGRVFGVFSKKQPQNLLIKDLPLCQNENVRRKWVSDTRISSLVL